MPDTPNLRAYDEAIEAAYFMRLQADALIENAAELEREAKKKASEYLGQQNARDGPLLSLRRRLMCKELGYNVPFDGPSSNIER